MFRRKIIVILSLTLLGLATKAQLKWPAVTSQTKPWTRWWWLGSEVNKPDLSTLIAQYKNAGLGGLEITPIYGVQGEDSLYIPFLSKKWMDMFDQTLITAKQNGL